MDKLVTTGKVTASPTVFARNRLEIAVKPGNPKGIRTLADLRGAGTVALCAASVPCGVYAANVLSRAGVTIPESSITRGADAKATLAAVSPGDANAAVVYVTDVKAARGAVQGVVIPDDQNAVAVYPLAPLAASSNARLARSFTAYVASLAGERTLARFGFLAP
jgi:molybdate transport system substrate-binding protein